MGTPNEWWGGLSEDVKDRLAGDPRAAIPDDLWEQVSAPDSAEVRWSDIERDPDGFHLPDELATFIERRTVRLVAD